MAAPAPALPPVALFPPCGYSVSSVFTDNFRTEYFHAVRVASAPAWEDQQLWATYSATEMVTCLNSVGVRS